MDALLSVGQFLRTMLRAVISPKVAIRIHQSEQINLDWILSLYLYYKVPFDYPTFRIKHIKMEGFNVGQWNKRWFEGLDQLRDWILEVRAKLCLVVRSQWHDM
jgi:hypothetical protein